MSSSIVESSPQNRIKAIVRIRPLNKNEVSNKNGNRSIIQVHPYPNPQHRCHDSSLNSVSSSSIMDEHQQDKFIHSNRHTQGYQVSIRNPSYDDDDDDNDKRDGDTNHSKSSHPSDTMTSICAPLKSYVFDHVHGPESTQGDVFDSVQYIVDSVIQGYHGTIFAYGQTGTGKTYTLFGESSSSSISQHDPSYQHSIPNDTSCLGVTQLSLRYLFHTMNELDSTHTNHYDKTIDKKPKSQTIYTVSFIEIYHDRVYDLLVSSSSTGMDSSKALTVREGNKEQGGVYVQDMKEIRVKSCQDAELLLRTGLANRHINETRANRKSSRSHAIYTIKVQSIQYPNHLKVVTQAKLTIVDLAGSERQKTTDVKGNILKEASSINKSLLFLGNLIDNLALKNSRKRIHQDRRISYRDCKLTFLLRDALGGNSKTCLIATISPSASCIGETISTLNFLQKAKVIENEVSVNSKTMETVAGLQQEVTKLRTQLKQLQALNTEIPIEINDEMIFTPSNKRLQEEVTMLRNQVKKLSAIDTELISFDDDNDDDLLSPRKTTPKASGNTSQIRENSLYTELESIQSGHGDKHELTLPRNEIMTNDFQNHSMVEIVTSSPTRSPDKMHGSYGKSVHTLDTDETSTMGSYTKSLVDFDTRRSDENLLQSMKELISSLPVVVLSNVDPLVVRHMESNPVKTSSNKYEFKNDSHSLPSTSAQNTISPKVVKTTPKLSNLAYSTPFNGGIDESRDDDIDLNRVPISLLDREESDDELSELSLSGKFPMHVSIIGQGDELGHDHRISPFKNQENCQESTFPIIDTHVYHRSIQHNDTHRSISRDRKIPPASTVNIENEMYLLRKQMIDLERSKQNDVEEAMTLAQQLQIELEEQTASAIDSLEKAAHAEAMIQQLQEELNQIQNEKIIQLQRLEREAQEVITSLEDKVQHDEEKQKTLQLMITTLETEVKVQEKAAQEAYQRAGTAEEYISHLRSEIQSMHVNQRAELEIVSTTIHQLENTIHSYAMDRAVSNQQIAILNREKDELQTHVQELQEKMKIQQSLDHVHAKDVVYELEDIIESKIGDIKKVLLNKTSTSHDYSISHHRSILHDLLNSLEDDLDDFRFANKQYFTENEEGHDNIRKRRSTKRWYNDYDPTMIESTNRHRRSFTNCGCFDVFN